MSTSEGNVERMYIKDIVVDGFKSYGRRVDVKGFDPHFNAITGSNGSGKSNLLEAICFALGMPIGSMTNGRASSLAELICGRSNVNNANVTITFHKPNGGDDITICRQITRMNSGHIKTNYMMNGFTTSPANLNKFLLSANLNVNNPTFLVMQGKMAKVVNMKPLEILSFLEETAGTSALEMKREDAKKKIKKKEEKLRNIEQSLSELIPEIAEYKQRLENCRMHKEVEKECEEISKKYLVYSYLKTSRSLQEVVCNKEAHEAEIRSKDEEKDNLESLIKEITKRLDGMHKMKDKESGGNLNKLMSHLRKIEDEESKLKVKINSVTGEINSEEREAAKLERQITEERESLSTSEENIKKLNKECEEMDIKHEQDTKDLSVAKKICGGNYAMGLKETESELSKQRSNAKENLAKSVQGLYACNLDLESKSKELNLNNTEFEKLNKTIDFGGLNKTKERISHLKDELMKFGIQDTTFRTIEDYKLNEKRAIKQLEGNISNAKMKNSRIYFDYTMPNAQFDRTRVRGTVCTLFKCKDDKFRLALETACGQLTSVVVDTSDVSRELIDRGKLTSRTTFVPLDKMITRPMSADVFRAAQRLVGADNVFWALELIEYDAKYKPVMNLVFGNTLICTSNKVAETVTYNASISKTTVTLNGSKYSPDGVGHGGTKPNSRLLLDVVQEVDNMQRNLDAKINNLQRFEEIFEKLQAEERKLLVGNRQIDDSGYYRIEKRIKQLTVEIKELEIRIKDYESSKRKEEEVIRQLDQKMASINKDETEIIEDAIKRKKFLEQAIANGKIARANLDKELQKSKVNVIACKGTINDHLSRLEETNEKIRDKKELLDNLQQKLGPVKEELRKMEIEVDEEKKRLSDEDEEMCNQRQRKEEIQNKLNEITTQLIIANGERDKLVKDIQTHEKELQYMKDKYDFIKYDRFEDKYDFTNYDDRQAKGKIKELEARKKSLVDAGISTRADCHVNLEKVKSLQKKKLEVTKDREKLLGTIEKLKEKKKIKITKAYNQVNKDFGSIFATLLPRSHAQLEPIDNEIENGLKIKVSLGNIWKNLTELSGGQRSLIGLSLILAMLKYKPAPIYILDEIDSALDSSHTQYIGEMIKKHFKQSQFIIVSLKEGLFNNANILFRVRLKNEVSTVKRLANVSN